MLLEKDSKYMFEEYYSVKLGKFKFILRPEEKRAFEVRLKDKDFASVWKKNRKNEYLASLEYAVRARSNSIIQIYGIPESGKSTIAQIIIYQLKEMLEKESFQPEIQLTYNYADTIHTISEFGKEHIVKAGEKEHFKPSNRRLIIFQDEQSNLQGSESRSYEKQLNTLLERFRAAQIFVILCTPNLREFSVCNTYIEAIAKDIEHRVNLALRQAEVRGGKKKKVETIGSIVFEYLPEIESYFGTYHELAHIVAI